MPEQVGRAVLARQLLAVGRLFVEVAVVGAFVWFWWWHPATGVAAGGEFYWPAPSVEGAITGTGTYLVVASVAGLLAGGVAAVRLGDHPWVALVGSLVAGAGAALLMAYVGHLLGPEDPATVAARSEDGTRVVGGLRVEGLGAYAAFPAAALLAVALVLLLTRPVPETETGAETGAETGPAPVTRG